MTAMLSRSGSVVRRAALALCVLAMCLCLPAAAQDGEADLDMFYSELERYGSWFEHPRYGYVWAPEVESGWRPYARGSWVYTEEHGWYWDAEEEWGWAPFHYGRWFYDTEYGGWVWVPGTEWAPAWVSWRYTDDSVGWAPLPPEAEWDSGELRFAGTSLRSPDYWMFVPAAALVSVGVYRYFLPTYRVRNLMVRSRSAPPLFVSGGRIFNRGYDVRRWERAAGRPIAPVRFNLVPSPRDLGARRDRRPGAGLYVYRPRFVVPPDRRGPATGPGPKRSGDTGGPRGPGRIGYSPMPPPKSPGLIVPDTKRKGPDRGKAGTSGPPAIMAPPPAVRAPGTPPGSGPPTLKGPGGPPKGPISAPKDPPTPDGRRKGPPDWKGPPAGDPAIKPVPRPPTTGGPPSGSTPPGPGISGPGKRPDSGPPPPPVVRRPPPPPPSGAPPITERPRASPGPGAPAFKGPPKGPDAAGPPKGPGGPGGPPPRGPAAAGPPKGPPPGGPAPPKKKDEKKDDKKAPPPS